MAITIPTKADGLPGLTRYVSESLAAIKEALIAEGLTIGGNLPITRAAEYIRKLDMRMDVQEFINAMDEGTLKTLRNRKITSIRDNALKGAKTLEEIYLPNATYLGSYTCYWPYRLRELYAPNVTEIGTLAISIVNGNYYHNKGDARYSHESPKITIGKLKAIPQNGIYNCDYLDLSQLDFSEVETIGGYGLSAVGWCSTKSVTLKFPKLTRIEGYALYGTSVQRIFLDSLDHANASAFQVIRPMNDDSAVTHIILRMEAPPSFFGTNNVSAINRQAQRRFYVPRNLMTAYQEHSFFSRLDGSNSLGTLHAIEDYPEICEEEE